MEKKQNKGKVKITIVDINPIMYVIKLTLNELYTLQLPHYLSSLF